MKKIYIFFFLLLILFVSCSQKNINVNLTVDNNVEEESNGFVLLRENKTKKAILIFEKEEDNYIRNLGLGYAYLKLNELENAKYYFNKALGSNESFSVYSGLAQLEENMGNYKRAYFYYRKASKIREDNFVNSKLKLLKERVLDSVKFELQNIDSGTEEWKNLLIEYLKINPENTLYREKLISYLYKSDKYDEVIKNYHQLLSYNAAPSEKTKFYYAKSLYNKSEYNKALNAMEEIYREFPNKTRYEDLYYRWKAKVESFKVKEHIQNISSSESITREQAAAILYSKLNKQIDSINKNPSIIIDIERSWAKDFIKRIVFASIMKVEDNHTFNPKKQITRMNAAIIYYRMINLFDINLKRKRYEKITDIPEYHIQRDKISLIVSNNLMSLNSNNRFNPSKYVSGKSFIETVEKIKKIIED